MHKIVVVDSLVPLPNKGFCVFVLARSWPRAQFDQGLVKIEAVTKSWSVVGQGIVRGTLFGQNLVKRYIFGHGLVNDCFWL